MYHPHGGIIQNGVLNLLLPPGWRRQQRHQHFHHHYQGEEIPQNVLDRLGEMHNNDMMRPLSENILGQLPTHKFSAPEDPSKIDSDKKQCTICMSEYEHGEDLLALTCFHFYHSECIKEWFKKQDFCTI